MLRGNGESWVHAGIREDECAQSVLRSLEEDERTASERAAALRIGSDSPLAASVPASLRRGAARASRVVDRSKPGVPAPRIMTSTGSHESAKHCHAPGCRTSGREDEDEDEDEEALTMLRWGSRVDKAPSATHGSAMHADRGPSLSATSGFRSRAVPSDERNPWTGWGSRQPSSCSSPGSSSGSGSGSGSVIRSEAWLGSTAAGWGHSYAHEHRSGMHPCGSDSIRQGSHEWKSGGVFSAASSEGVDRRHG